MMNYSKTDIGKNKKILFDLYSDGIVKVSNIFDQSFLNDIKSAKDQIFSLYPYGQNENLKKILDRKTINGNYLIRNPLELDPIFKKILEDKSIVFMAQEILGKDFYFTDMSMRIIPKTKHILETHRDYCGGLSFSLLLDDISTNQGETFFFKGSYKYPPPVLVDLNSFSSTINATTGVTGDVYFWFPDNWHGRNYNLSDKETCILMVDIENKNTDRKIISIYKNNINKKFTLLDKIFKAIGNDPNNFLKHFFYCLLRYKILKKTVEDKKTIYCRLIIKNDFSQGFSYFDYFKMIKFKKFLRTLMSEITQLVVGKKFFLKLKNIIK